MNSKYKIVSLIFLLIISVGVILVGRQILTNTTIEDSQAVGSNLEATKENLTLQTLDLLNTISGVSVPSNTESRLQVKPLEEQAKLRSENLIKIAETDPEYALSLMIPSELREKMPENVKAYIEKESVVQGKLSKEIIDDFEKDTSLEVTLLKTNDKTYRVYSDLQSSSVTSGDQIKANVWQIDDNILIESANVEVVQSSIGTNYGPELKVASILFNYPSSVEVTKTKEEIRSIVYDSVDDFYKENSFGKLKLIGKNSENGEQDIFGPFFIEYVPSGDCFDTFGEFYPLIQEQILNANIDLTGYENILLFSQDTIGCYGGRASRDTGLVHIASANNTIEGLTGTVAHELGHNLGAGHASSISCIENGVVVPISDRDNCVSSTYGDAFNIMGSSYFINHFSGNYKGHQLTNFSWLDPSNIVSFDYEVPKQGIYKIYPSQKETNEIQLIEIPRKLNGYYGSEYYYLEFRQAFGFDSDIPSDISNSVLLRIGESRAPSAVSGSSLIDNNLGGESNLGVMDAGIKVGQTFEDAIYGIKIQTLAVDSESATVKIDYEPKVCPNIDPEFTAYNTTAVSGEFVYIALTLKSLNPTNCNPVSYKIVPYDLPPGLIAYNSATYATLYPGSEVERGLIFQTNNLTDGDYEVKFMATDVSNQSKQHLTNSNIRITSTCIRGDAAFVIAPQSLTIPRLESGTFDYILKNNDSSDCEKSAFQIYTDLGQSGLYSPTGGGLLKKSLEPGQEVTGQIELIASQSAIIGEKLLTTEIKNINTQTVVAEKSFGVNVTDIPQQCIPTVFDVTITPKSTNVLPGGTVTYDYSFTNNDSELCSEVEFEIRNESQILETQNSVKFKLFPTQSKTGSFSVDIKQSAAVGLHDIKHFVRDISSVPQRAGQMIVNQVNISACARANPTFTLQNATSTSVVLGETVLYNYQIKNNDSADCGSSVFELLTTGDGGLSRLPRTIAFTIQPGKSTLVSTFGIYTSGVVTQEPRRYTLKHTVQNVSSTQHKSSANTTIVVNPPIKEDATKPVVNILTPTTRGSLSRDFTILTAAKDISGISNIKIFIDDKRVVVCKNTSTCSFNVLIKDLTKGKHQIKVTATDNSSKKNSTTESVTITRR